MVDQKDCQLQSRDNQMAERLDQLSDEWFKLLKEIGIDILFF